MPPALELRGLSKRFGALTALDALTLGVDRGEIFGLLAPNGSGKTTTINIVKRTFQADRRPGPRFRLRLYKRCASLIAGGDHQVYASQPDDPIDIHVQETDLRAQDIDLLQFELIPDLVLLLTIAGAINAGLATAREWEDQTIKELLLAPISRGSLIVGKLLAGWLTTLLIAAIILSIGAATGYLRPSASGWPITLLTVALLALASAGLGVAIGAAARRFQRVAALTIPLAFYLFFLSGGISVIAFLPEWVQTIAHFIPTYYGMHALQMVVFYDSTEDLGRDLLVLVGTSAITLGLGIVSLRRSLVA